MATIDPKTDPKYLEYDDEVQRLTKLVAYLEANKKSNLNSLLYLNEFQKDLAKVTAKRDNRFAKLTQTGVNAQAGEAGAEAIKNENLLAQNINQEIQGRIARNAQQAGEAMTGIDSQSGATIGRQRAKAGQAGYGASSGTASALADAAAAKSDEEKAAIEGYRVGRQNLLMGQGEAANKAAESLSGSINTTTADWADKGTSAVKKTTGAYTKNLLNVVNSVGFNEKVDLNTQGLKDSKKAVETTLDTWSFDSYMNTLNTLTGHSSNKSTWDQMLLDQVSTPVNPYGSAAPAIAPLTPVAGTQSNMLAAAAAGAPSLNNVYTLSGSKSKKSGSLI